ncbi:hypothetical protein BDW42DRAFT_171359 [Aspergillus taichungensis]|uniref:Uncharacterized protein n=1 Tax=Aspergillus taichungensis TaxID=482145 RepID=A0A2J5HS90_9EURO|nr:hypothetical protein BDW42DRAFT_171359 [Aspergillus taichungensis]
MKFALTTISFVATSLAASLPSSFTLVAEGGNTLLTDGNHALIAPHLANHLPILILNRIGDQITYTSDDAPPFTWQNLYVVEGDIEPIGLTNPYTGAMPANASISGFGVNEQGHLTHKGNTEFGTLAAAEDDKPIWWLGYSSGRFDGVPLWVKELRM